MQVVLLGYKLPMKKSSKIAFSSFLILVVIFGSFSFPNYSHAMIDCKNAPMTSKEEREWQRAINFSCYLIRDAWGAFGGALDVITKLKAGVDMINSVKSLLGGSEGGGGGSGGGSGGGDYAPYGNDPYNPYTQDPYNPYPPTSTSSDSHDDSPTYIPYPDTDPTQIVTPYPDGEEPSQYYQGDEPVNTSPPTNEHTPEGDSDTDRQGSDTDSSDISNSKTNEQGIKSTQTITVTSGNTTKSFTPTNTGYIDPSTGRQYTQEEIRRFAETFGSQDQPTDLIKFGSGPDSNSYRFINGMFVDSKTGQAYTWQEVEAREGITNLFPTNSYSEQTGYSYGTNPDTTKVDESSYAGSESYDQFAWEEANQKENRDGSYVFDSNMLHPNLFTSFTGAMNGLSNKISGYDDAKGSLNPFSGGVYAPIQNLVSGISNGIAETVFED